MFERYLTDALTTHFGHFVENLDADKVRISAWNGEVVLQDLSLRPNALEFMIPDCPVELTFGRVGHLELRIPWSLFRSQLRWKPGQQHRYLSTSSPCSIVLSDVNILITPRRRRDSQDQPPELEEGETEEVEDNVSIDQRRILKEKQVQSMLDGNLLRRVTESSVTSSRWSWVQDWLSTLLSTLSVTIRNIHIRYEDPGTCMGFVWDTTTTGPRSFCNKVPRSIRQYRPSFAIGITLRQFSVESEDQQLNKEEKESEGKNNLEVASSNVSSVVRRVPYALRKKLAEAESLAVYWDSDCNLMAMHSDTLCRGDDRSMEYSSYYHAAFRIANDNFSSSGHKAETETIFAHESLYKQQHSYVLDPISPSVNLTLVSPKNSLPSDAAHAAVSMESATSIDFSDDSSNDGSTIASTTGLQHSALLPPSSVRLHLPPCTLTLARSTLEDTAYIRKSLSIWRHATKGILSEATIRRLAKLRPSQSPKDDPRNWWHYAVEATLALSQFYKERRDRVNMEAKHRPRRRLGWKGFWEAYQLRKRYVTLYQALVPRVEPNPKTPELLDSNTAHKNLLEMEDELLTEEIVAFRLAFYESWKSAPLIHHHKTTKTETMTSSSGWQIWSKSFDKQTGDVLMADQIMLTLGHRLSMLEEMSLALQRERTNVLNIELEESRQASLQHLPALDHTDKKSCDEDTNPILWDASLACKEIAVQINDESADSTRFSNCTTPVLRFSCAWVQDQRWYQDGSWDIDCSLASLLVKDMTVSKTKNSHGYFPNLIARKVQHYHSSNTEDVIWIDGNPHHKGLSIAVRRNLHWNRDNASDEASDHVLLDIDRGSTTTSRIRIFPMEVVYSTVPVEVATRVLGAVKTTELVDDYHRMAAAAHGWQERQKKKFLAALAHKGKKIIVDVDVGAPELLIPEDINQPESPMLAIDLGRLRIFNDDVFIETSLEYDDQWRLALSDIQVRSATVASFGQEISLDTSTSAKFTHARSSPRQLVEPFSLDLIISTRIAVEETQDPIAQTKIRVLASLPRLAFNLNSSSIRLVSRLQQQWEMRRSQKNVHSLPPSLIIDMPTAQNNSSNRGTNLERYPDGESSIKETTIITNRVSQFDFTAPVIRLRLDSDTGDTRNGEYHTSIPLLDLAFRGIRGTLLQEFIATGESSMLFDARLHSLGVIDLYQTAGNDFALLMSSALPENLDGLVLDGETYSWAAGNAELKEFRSGKDLVTIKFSSTNAKGLDDLVVPDKLSIGFHELYVEWNPETIATIQKAIQIPDEAIYGPVEQIKDDECASVSDEEFFDAMENTTFVSEHEIASIRLLSEVASSSFDTAEPGLQSSLSRQSSWTSSALSLAIPSVFPNNGQLLISPHRMVHSAMRPFPPNHAAYPPQASDSRKIDSSLEKTEHVGEEKPFELKFELSKLRVSFNKESRYRKVMIAQMDGTIISYKTRTSGGSRTNMKIGNLVFTDPATTKNSTLYSQILGLKTGTEDAKGDQLSSLLEMEILVNPKTRSFEAGINQLDDSPSKPVEIDLQRGTVIGCNFFVRAKFSPMRFVFLEQLWFEFIDYFFEGIIGNAVWGGQRSGQLTSPLIESTIDVTSGSRYLPGSDAKGFNFTRFDIQLDTPELLFPVTYRSPHFLRLDLGSIHVTNKYDTTLIDSEGKDLRARMQWFNNCTVALDSLRIFSWTGQELGQNPFIASVALRWPIGPTARLVTPKWTVNCRIDSLDIALRRTDYALIQHIISNNIGEESRHLNEWQALQKLSQADIVAYTESILVHYGYDNKDVTPTTYDLKVTIPCVRVEFIEFEKDVTAPVSVARCIDLIWSLRKDSDLVIKQKATFDINLSAPSSSSSSGKLLSSWKYDQDILMEDAESDSNEDIPELTFTSTTLPNGDNTKTLEIVDACIYADFRAWRGLSGFFSALPEVSLMNADEIASSIQVGDRWYRIGGNAKHHSDMQIDDESATTFRWINSIPLLRNVVSTRPMLPVSQKSLWPTFQIRVTLTSPRIILSSDPVDGSVSRLVLRMSHFDFLQTNSGVNCKVTRSFFLDEVEVYTLSGKTSRKRKRQDGNSLIHPWSVGGIMEKCNGRSVGNCEKHYTKISADTLQARAAYSDMAIAIEVCLSVTQSSRIDNNQVGGISKSVSSDSFSETSQTTRTESQHSINTEVSNDDFCSTPKTSLFDVECEGFELLVEDDSGRHFATNQELIILSLDKVLFSRNEHHGKPSSLHLRLHGFDLFDCLQSSDSPFRTAASTRQGVTSLNKRGSGVETGSSYQFRDESPSSGSSVFCWDSYKMQEISDFKFKPSTTLLQRLNVSSEHCLYLLTDNGKENSILPSRMIEVTCIFATRAVQKYHIKLHSLSVQWNPSTVIAIQRFLGRLRKESNSKISQVFPGDIDHLIATKSMELDEEVVDAPSRSDFTESSTVEAIIELHELKVCLNKEHQNRRLLEMSLLTCRLELYSSNEGLIVDGQVGSLSAWDSDEYVNGIHPVNRHVVKVISGSPPLGEERHQNLLNLYYRTFKDSHSKSHTTPLPPWVQAHASEIGGIDDFLSVRVAATEFTYLKERTEEMVDYLSNGLPGKGMGVTSRAAKGFISKRILTKSFLEFQNDSPQIFLPQHELCSNGVSLKLGDVSVRSYFEQDNVSAQQSPHARCDWWRILSLELSGFQVGVREVWGFSPATNPIDLDIHLRKPTTKVGELSVRGKLSFFDVTLKYSDYVLIRCVVSDNIGKTVDTAKWDNIEKAYWSEYFDVDQMISSFSMDDELSKELKTAENRVAYSSNARFVRYGKGGKRKPKCARNDDVRPCVDDISPSTSLEKPGNTIDVKFILDGLSLKLTRDDALDGIDEERLASEFWYDILLLRVQVVEISLSSTDTGDISFHLSLFRLGLFDLGDRGRSIREHYDSSLATSSVSSKKRIRKGPRQPCPFQIIAEGYDPEGEQNGTVPSVSKKQDEPQFVVTMERYPTSSAGASRASSDLDLPPGSQVTIARIVVNYLSLNILIRPVKEALSFVSCEWHLLKHTRLNLSPQPEIAEQPKTFGPAETSENIPRNGEFQLKIVAHYPRVFFLADESYRNSRALVLRGLAVVHMSSIKKSRDSDVQHVTSIDAQLNSMESYINADVYQALCFKPSHVAMVGNANMHHFPKPEEDQTSTSDPSKSLGVALIQPVTAGFEFCQIKRDLFPTKRSLSVNIESVSTMLSFEDLSLIETVLARLSSARSSKKPHEKNNKHGDLLSISLSESSEEYGRERNQPPLGAPRRATGMYMPESYQVTFDAKRLGLGLTTKGGKIIVNSIQDTRYKESIQLGDSLVSIGDFECIGCPLDDVVQELSRSRRPITLSFRTRNSPLRHRKLVEFTTSPLPEKMHDASNTRKFSIASYRIYFKKGVSTGFVLEPSSCGRFPVVTKVLPSCPFASSESIVDDTNAGQIEATLNHGGANIPRPGAVVVAVNDVKIEELGVETTWAEIKEMVDRVPSETDSHQYYSLSFREIDSSLWGNVDTIDLSSAGFALSFIDDLNGRDMPLFRAKVEALEAHAERGLGGRAQIIEVQPSSILSLEPTSISETSPIVTLDEDQIGDLKFESVLTVSGIAMCSVDYFHPRIAFWEPFVEPSQIFGILEMQSGSLISKRPGQVAVELSDRLLREQSFRANQLPSFGGIPKIVTVNLTDSSVEVAVKTISQWKDWRKSLQVFSEDEEGDTCSQMDADIELRESNPLAEVPVLATTTKFREDEQPGAFSLEARAHRNAKRAAKQRAAQAALVFAEKRGAGNSRKVDSAKPFVLRNRTGVSIAFVQENNVLRGNSVSTMSNKKEKNFAAVGEYAGLADYDPTFIHELGDKEDARFSMEIISDRLLANENHSITACHPPPNKVRNYEGCFPSLTIAIQAVSGVSINPLVDLQVYKVGSSVRHLIVRKDIDQTKKGEHDDVEYSIPVVWKVEIKDNRRVLTLSTAVRVVTTAFSTQMEVGVQSILNHECGEHVRRAVNSIGVVRPDSPFYLPLWLALKLEAVSVFVRPQVDEAARFDWGRSSILRFSPVLSVSDDVRDVESIGTWVWEETFEELDYVRCDSIGDMASPIWLAVFSGSSSNSVEQFIGSKTKKTVSSMNFEEEHHEVISVTLDSNVTLRNMLPLSLDWQLAHASYGSASPSIVDGSLIRRETNMRINEHLSAVSSSLHSGECTEVFACDFESSELRARFKEPNGQNWSSWAHLTLQNSVEDDEHEDDDDYTTNVLIPKAVQVNVQVINDTFGIPLTLGVRIVPKTTLGTLEEPSKTQIYGIEIIVYAELWIRNVTSLPLNFGCPSYQVHGHGESVNETFEDTATRFNAESALMEIANLLEVGDKGTGLSTKAARDVAITGGIESLPNQQCEELWEEVFEYLEIEYSTVKRRWWASESYDSFRMNITQSNETGRWSWIGENWSIDTAGEVDAALGGWESSRNLLAGVGSFAGNRAFDPSHAIRRRRYFRNRTGHQMSMPRSGSEKSVPRGCLQAFHQPLKDSFSREQKNVMRKKNRKKNINASKGEGDWDIGTEAPLKVAVRCGDGKWSMPAIIPDKGTAYGVFRVLASRWPALTKSKNNNDSNGARAFETATRGPSDLTAPYKYNKANLSSTLYDLCYVVTDVEGEWGEFSRVMSVAPRFMMRNDSTRFSIEVKQAGTPDSSSLKLPPGAAEGFYWEDFRLPGLVSVSPCVTNDEGRSVYKWSGGFDISNLGMVPLRIRHEISQHKFRGNCPLIRSMRALVEIRPGTGGFGINISFREEDPDGDGSLFRIENLSHFPIWLSQDGVLANPSTLLGQSTTSNSSCFSIEEFDVKSGYVEDYEANGDLIRHSEKISFGLDVPYRQGKYAHRKEATLKELLHVRVALAPLAHRAGVETVKVIGLTTVGDSIRLNPSKLFDIVDDDLRLRLQAIRVIAVVCSDGPTRVLKIVLGRVADQYVIGNAFREVSYMASRHASGALGASPSAGEDRLCGEIKNSALVAIRIYNAGQLESEENAAKQALFATLEKQIADKSPQHDLAVEGTEMDHIYSIRAEFSGFLFSLIDSTPSEIAVATLRNFNVLARWNGIRTNEASLMLSVGWLQIDNHVPSAPFKVAVRPDILRRNDGEFAVDSESEHGSCLIDTTPLLLVAIAFAPKHKSGIICLRSVTIAPRNLMIALDLAFLVRLQRYLMGLKDHLGVKSTEDEFSCGNGGVLMVYTEQKRNVTFPHFETAEEELQRVAAFGSEHQKFYFQGLTILPSAITLFVAPARALSPAQASLEGKEVAAIHQAVRKGDILVGSSSALLGVRVGRKNTTPLAVVRGVFKSIVVDALLRLDGASLNFSGVYLRNHISTGPQLTTYLLQHYMASLRQNVPALLGSLAAFGNPIGLIRGLGDGMSDFVSQPVRGLKKSMEELDPMYLVDGVARGTESLARHAVGGFADSASLLTETFSKNMAVLTLDRRYAQKRDRSKQLRLNAGTTVTLAGGVESGFVKLVQGFMEGVTGVVKAPIRGAEKRGIEGFAKGVGKGLLGLLVKPIIGISDAATDVMIGVKNSVEHTGVGQQQSLTLERSQFRPRRPFYGRDKVLRPYKLEDAAAAALMVRTRCAGENYLSHLDLGDRVALLSVKRFILLGPKGQELMALKYKHVTTAEVRQIPLEDNTIGWAIIIVLNTPRKNGSEVEVLSCKSQQEAIELCSHLQQGIELVAGDR